MRRGLLLLALLLPAAARAEDRLPTPFSPPITWQSRGTAQLQALDKINARRTQITVKVGQSATFGSLTIIVKGCVVRPPDQPADAAAFLEITDKNPEVAGFSGWMLRSDPSLSMLAHPIFDVRVTGCSA